MVLPESCTLYSEAPIAVARMHSPAGNIGHPLGDRLGILPPQHLARQYDNARIDVVRMQPRPRIGVVDDPAQRRIVDPLFALVRRQRHRGLIDPRKRQRVRCRRLNRLQPDDEGMAKNAYRLCNARQFGPVVRVEQAADFLFIDAESLRELGLTDAGLAHRNV